MKFKKTRNEVWLGTLRCTVDEEAKKLFSDSRVISRRDMGDGNIFLMFGDGHVEHTTQYKEAMKMVEEMKEREKQVHR